MLPELEFENLSHDELIKEAKQRRRNPTTAEKLLWHRLRRRRMRGFYFCRHAVRKNFIFDFYCSELKLIIEIDYSVGNLLTEFYQERDVRLQGLGYLVLRFKEVQVLKDFSSVINRIEEFVVRHWRSKKKIIDSNKLSGINPNSSGKDPIPGPSPREGKGTRAAGGKGFSNQDKPTYFTVSRQTRDLLIEQAREMRKTPTKAEALLCGELRGKKLCGYKFRRQHPLGSFIVDFYCPLRKLVIELDGSIHDSQKAYDAMRENYLKSMGFQILRFDNLQVEQDLNSVLKEITGSLLDTNEK